jgi:hypothetical protein
MLKSYDKQRSCWTIAQLEFENLSAEVKGAGRTYRNSAQIREQLRTLESYLGDLITEWENNRKGLSDESPEIIELSRLRGLVSRSSQSGFKQPLSGLSTIFKDSLLSRFS